MKEIMKELQESEAIIQGHFLLSSGKHSNMYCQCAKLLQYPERAEKVLKNVAKKLEKIEYDLIVGPAMGGIIVAYELSRLTGKRGIFTERVDQKMVLKRGFEINKGDKIVISEDVITTGKSSLEVKELLESMGAKVVAMACIVDRRDKNVKFELPVFSALELEIETYEKESCPLCLKNIDYVKPGSRNIK